MRNREHFELRAWIQNEFRKETERVWKEIQLNPGKNIYPDHDLYRRINEKLQNR